MSHEPGRTEPAQVGLRRLTTADTKVFEGTFGLLHCEVQGEALYQGVFAVMLFPISQPDRFISLRHTDSQDKIGEIGVIEELSDFPPDQQRLVRENLAKHYHERIIRRVHEVKYRHGILYFTVETQLGQEQFLIPWKQERAEPYGAKGKVLLDAFDNRYVIPDVSALPAADQRKFTLYIYW